MSAIGYGFPNIHNTDWYVDETERGRSCSTITKILLYVVSFFQDIAYNILVLFNSLFGRVEVPSENEELKRIDSLKGQIIPQINGLNPFHEVTTNSSAPNSAKLRTAPRGPFPIEKLPQDLLPVILSYVGNPATISCVQKSWNNFTSTALYQLYTIYLNDPFLSPYTERFNGMPSPGEVIQAVKKVYQLVNSSKYDEGRLAKARSPFNILNMQLRVEEKINNNLRSFYIHRVQEFIPNDQRLIFLQGAGPDLKKEAKMIREWMENHKDLLGQRDKLKLDYNPIPPEIRYFTNLRELRLSGNQIAMIPSELTDLSNLQVLSLSYNTISIIPPELGRLTNLQELRLKNNRITVIPTEFAALTNLQELDFSHNQSTLIPTELGRLTNLLRLDLNDNQITLIPTELGRLTKLQVLRLNSNKIILIPPELAGLANLLWLALDSNKITLIPPELACLANLHVLDLNDNQITLIPTELACLANLDVLDLSDNKITLIPIELGTLINLEKLRLINNLITVIPTELARLTNLRVLKLEDNRITVIPTEFAALTSLQKLDLANNLITAIPTEFAALTSLQRLDLRKNPIEAIPPALNFLRYIWATSVKDSNWSDEDVDFE